VKKPITTKNIAQLAGVSVGTVPHVLNGSAGVSKELQKRVHDVVSRLEYQPSQLARGLRRRSTDLLGVIIPDITNPYFPRVVRGIEDVAYREGLRLVLCNTDNDAAKEISYFNDLRSFHPAGIIVIPSQASTLANESSNRNLQIIFVDRCPEGWTGDAVTANNEDGGYQVGRYLTLLGHKSLAAISGPLDIEPARDRLRGFQRALAEAKLKLPPKYIQEVPFTTEAGYSAALRLLALVPRPLAIFAASDTLAIGALAAARELGLRCPDDLSIVGFDDLEFSKVTEPSLTTIFQPGYDMGAIACEMLLSRVRGGDHPAQRRIMDTELRIRNSVRSLLPPR
jgi:DNA-binding LacI/PurR family transcriptional regulator